MAIDIYLVRHGETVFNQQGIIQGWCDSPLTEKGKRMAQALGEKWKDLPFDAVFASDLPRAQHTAQLIVEGAQQNLPVQSLPQLREFHFGAFEKGKSADLHEKVARFLGFEGSLDQWLQHRRQADKDLLMLALSQMDEQAENEACFRQRLRFAMDEVVQKVDEGARVLVVAHGMSITGILKNIDEACTVYQSVPNVSVSRLVFADGRFSVLSVGEVV